MKNGAILILPSAQAARTRMMETLVSLVVQNPKALLCLDPAAELSTLWRQWSMGHTQHLNDLRVTTTQEFLGFSPEHENGLAFELLRQCPPLRSIYHAGGWLPLPAGQFEAQHCRQYRQRLDTWGGVDALLLGPGLVSYLNAGAPDDDGDVSGGLQATRLRSAARSPFFARFGPTRPPTHLLRWEMRGALAARQLLFMATGEEHAAWVAEVLEGDIPESDPRAILRQHGNPLVILDQAAASQLAWPAELAAAR